MKLKLFLVIISLFSKAHTQVTGLSDWNIFIDPGHSQDENMGVNGYSEAKEVLMVGLHLKDILENQTDIDTVFISRTNNEQSVSLYQRTNYANTLGAAWYHSVHSDASSNYGVNKTLLLWGELNNGNPDPPQGGESMSAHMIEILTQGMRIETSGSWGDCSFYFWSDYCSNSGGPYLYVNRNTNMPSELSEEGHHSNPEQNQLAMNEEYKRMLAYLLYWSILEYHNIERPDVGKLAGHIIDIESDKKINGAMIRVEDQNYITDTYASLFYQYSAIEENLSNGFFWFEELFDSDYEIIVSAPGYYGDTSSVIMSDTFITFHDVALLSNKPPSVVNINPSQENSSFPAWEPFQINFSRPMDTNSVSEAFMINPIINSQMQWVDLQTLIVNHDTLLFETDYVLIIDENAKDLHGHGLDGNVNGFSGGDFILSFSTGPLDMEPPDILNVYPANVTQGVEILPLINVQFDEELNSSQNFYDYFRLEHFQSNSAINGDLVYYPVGSKSSLCFFPFDNLHSNEVYVIRLYSGLIDNFDNSIDQNESFSFQTTNLITNATVIDDLEYSFDDYWWEPHISGSTIGIFADSTWMKPNNEIVNHLFNSNISMEVSYGWNIESEQHLIRVYLNNDPESNVIFYNNSVLQAYVFGDGSGNRFRFCVDDNYFSSSESGHEVSPWYNIDWVGWKLISWDMDETGDWIGDGLLDGGLKFDSFQLSYNFGQSQFGKIFIDNLRLLDQSNLSIANNQVSNSFTIGKNYPNPFNVNTKIPVHLGQESDVELVIYDLLGNRIMNVVHHRLKTGDHFIDWDGKDHFGNYVPSGIYPYTLKLGQISKSDRMILLK